MVIPIDKITEQQNLGSYQEAEGEKFAYYYNFKGPLSIKFNEKVEIRPIKVETTDNVEPVILLKIELIYAGKQEWIFESIGVDAQGLGFINWWDS